jgi:hypothetical protein
VHLLLLLLLLFGVSCSLQLPAGIQQLHPSSSLVIRHHGMMPSR